MKEGGIIRPSDSPWAAPVVLARKKGNDVQVCVDYCKLNGITVSDAYPLPCINDTPDLLARA